jgi:protocatechuate 3,4-dioxygenase beta subunit
MHEFVPQPGFPRPDLCCATLFVQDTGHHHHAAVIPILTGVQSMGHIRIQPSDRRRFLGTVVTGAALFTTRGLFADELVKTPAQTEGPFYPNHLPLDTDNDLIVINDETNPAVGEITHLTGRILDAKGDPLRNAVVEIWQCDHSGAYLHTGTMNKERRDTHFQGFGRFLTGSTGEYYFRTIKPVAYPGRTPHIHFKIWKGREELLTTQCYIQGYPGNPRDGIWRSITDEKARNAVTVPFQAIPESKIGELTAKFDVVLGFTPRA